VAPTVGTAARKLGDEGLEPNGPEIAVTTQDLRELRRLERVADESGGAESGAVGASIGVWNALDDPRLLALIDGWPMISEKVREAIARLAVVPRTKSESRPELPQESC
jgi:hypothetical protein